MDGSSSQGPFMLAALIAIMMNSLFSEPDVSTEVKRLNQVEQNTILTAPEAVLSQEHAAIKELNVASR